MENLLNGIGIIIFDGLNLKSEVILIGWKYKRDVIFDGLNFYLAVEYVLKSKIRLTGRQIRGLSRTPKIMKFDSFYLDLQKSQSDFFKI